MSASVVESIRYHGPPLDKYYADQTINAVFPLKQKAHFLLLTLLTSALPASAITFNFTEGTGLVALRTGTPSNVALANQVSTGFSAAAALWSSQLSNNYTFNLTIDYQALGAGILGSAGSDTVGLSYSSVRTALIASATSANDLTSVASLSNTSSLSFITNNRAGTRITDNDGSSNNSVLDVTRANAKALGLLAANASGVDTSITFSSNFGFDFNRADGITIGTYDFVGIAAHEIGHGLGFISGVDDVDAYTGFGPNAGTDLNGGTAGIGTLDPYRLFTPLDLFRYSAPNTRDLAFGGTPYFSINSGLTNSGLFSTGSYNGDGRQASHWKDNLGLGIMDPTAAAGEFLSISTLDRQALDVIGYTFVPEPSTWAFYGVFLATGSIACTRRRKLARSSSTSPDSPP